MSYLTRHLSELARLIDEEIKKLIPKGDYPNLYDGVEYAIFSAGKRLRPIMCLLVCKTLGGGIHRALPVAAAIEIMHNATLVHDDIEDGDKIRRGKELA